MKRILTFALLTCFVFLSGCKQIINKVEETNLQDNAPSLWIQYPNATGFRCFYLDTSLDNYDNIPYEWRNSL